MIKYSVELIELSVVLCVTNIFKNHTEFLKGNSKYHRKNSSFRNSTLPQLFDPAKGGTLSNITLLRVAL